MPLWRSQEAKSDSGGFTSAQYQQQQPSQVPEHCVIRSLGGHKPSKHSRSGPGSLLNLYGKLEFISQKGIFMGKDWDLYFLKNWKSIQFYV